MPFGTVGTVCKNNCPTLCPPSKPCSSRHWDTWDSWDSQNILQRTRDMTGMLDLRHLQQTTTTGHPHPWPVLHELNETFKVGALPAMTGADWYCGRHRACCDLKRRQPCAMPGTIWKPCCMIWIWSICPGKCGWLCPSTHRPKEGVPASCRIARNAAANCWCKVQPGKDIA